MRKRGAAVFFCILLLLLLVFIAKNAGENKSVQERKLAKAGQWYDPTESNLTITDSLQPNDNRQYTIMIYMIGSNLESRLGNATKDLEEIEQSDYDNENVNVIVYTGGSRRWVGNVPSGYNCVIDMSKSEEDRIVAHTEGNADMGAAETLSAFVNFCSSYYPAEHNALIFWDHGGGPLWGFGADELFNLDGLLLPEMQNAMRKTMYYGDKKLDFVGFDACLMACIESMNVWKEFAQYYIASEELEPGDGWDYSFLGNISDAYSVKDVANLIIDYFAEYYKRAVSDFNNPDITLSCVDLSAIGKVYASLDKFSSKLWEENRDGKYSEILKSRAKIKELGLSDGLREGEKTSSYDLVDLSDMTDNLAWMDQKASSDLLESIDRAVVKTYSNLDQISGISLYYPYANKSQYRQKGTDYKRLSSSLNYNYFLSDLTNNWLSNKRDSWNLGDISEDETGRYIQLSETQIENMTNAYYSVLSKDDTFGFLPVLEQMTIEPDPNGRLYLPSSIDAVVIDSEREGLICPIRQIESGRKRNLYSTIGLRADSSPLFLSYIDGIECLDINIIFEENLENGELSIQSINSADDSISMAGKNTIDISEWSGIQILYHGLIPKNDGYGEMLPSSEWLDSGYYGWEEGNYGMHLAFHKYPVEKCSAKFIGQIQVEDCFGDLYATNYCELPHNPDFCEKVYQTNNGEITYRLYKDYAICMKYSGSDKSVVLPKEIDGIPLTKIYRQAFGGQKSLQNLSIPRGIREIGSGAFQECENLESVNLPDTLNKIGIGIFAGCSNLKEIGIEDNNDYFMIKDNILFSKDNKILYACPAALSGIYFVPEGTEEIAYAAFCNSSLSQIVLPSSLQKICDYAFYNAQLAGIPVFSDELSEIGVRAFGCGIIDSDLIPEKQEEIVIGKNVLKIGTEAFSMFTAKRFEVDMENPYYSSVEGNLMNKAGDYLIQFATRKGNVVVIPNGIKEFTKESMEFFDIYSELSTDKLIHIQIPSSVERFPTEEFVFSEKMVIHCDEGSMAEEYAIENGISYSHEMYNIFQ
ncbi:clostripain-related cysteine peptidase [Butyrivibrio sp. AC2005]|uniref:clostripain-related cysteine peptidase n=1 Tax=Butyrivibrio sp. AC2005 TaxID=1280672 RepID=UPI0004046BF0|nr:clostripain-related cysteine peptidase [Butyrivibrio sp. AC2005]